MIEGIIGTLKSFYTSKKQVYRPLFDEKAELLHKLKRRRLKSVQHKIKKLAYKKSFKQNDQDLREA